MRFPKQLLHDIQESLLDASDVSPVLLKLRLLASRVGSVALEEWVKCETEGYPAEVEVPDYRKVGVEYRGTFSDGVRVLNDVQIPPLIIKNVAGENWVINSMRQPLAEIEHLVQRINTGSSSGKLAIGGAANLWGANSYSTHDWC